MSGRDVTVDVSQHFCVLLLVERKEKYYLMFMKTSFYTFNIIANTNSHINYYDFKTQQPIYHLTDHT